MTRIQHSLPSNQSQRLLPTPLAMSATTAEPTPFPIPKGSSPKPSPIPRKPSRESIEDAVAERPGPKPPSLPATKLRLRINDLTHPGALVFFNTAHPINTLTDAITIVLQTLYTPFESTKTVPPTKSVTLVLRHFKDGGVAYTTNNELDDDDKEIHFNLGYIERLSKNPTQRQRDEIAGVLVHEMVHCWQWYGLGTAPGGLIEGIADFVRLRAGLGPPHWKRVTDCDWDAGYDRTAYFLEWIEKVFGEGSVMRINEKLRTEKYDEKVFWKGLFKTDVGELWKRYTKTLSKDEKSDKLGEDKSETDEGARAKTDKVEAY